MKSTLLSLAVAVLATATASAESFEFGYCDDTLVDYWGNVNAMGAAIEIPAEEAAQMVGYKVVGMKVGAGEGASAAMPFVAHYFGSSTDRSYLCKKQVKLEAQEWNEVIFDTPYTITEQGFFIGYFISGIPSKKRPIATDGSTSPSPYNWAGWGSSASAMWASFEKREDMGNFSIRLIIEGESMPADRVTLRDFRLPLVVSPGESFDAYADITNSGYNDITSVSGTVTLGDDTPVPFDITLDQPMAHGDKRTITISDLVYPRGGINVSAVMTVDKVNGVDNQAAVNTVTVTFNCSNEGYERNVVVEEGTGTWCGNCVYGIYGMEYMSEAHTDGSFIPLAVHVNDALVCSDYAQIINTYFGSVPAALVNRFESIYPSRSTLVDTYPKYRDMVYSRVKIEASFTSSSRSEICITAISEFGTDHEDIDYALGFILSEDKVGPYAQTNYASGTSADVGGLEKMGDPAYLMLNDVVRKADGVYGLADSAITSAEAGAQIEYTHTMSTRDVGNVENMKVTAIQIDRKTGHIVNGVQIKYADIKNGGSNIIATEADNAPVEYYNLQGVRVDTPSAAGIYVRRQGSVTDKVVIR